MQAICNSTNHLEGMLCQLGFKFPASFKLFMLTRRRRPPRRNLVPRAHVTRPLVSLNKLTPPISGQAAQSDSKWRRAVLNFGPLWRGISVGSDCTLEAKTTVSNST